MKPVSDCRLTLLLSNSVELTWQAHAAVPKHFFFFIRRMTIPGQGSRVQSLRTSIMEMCKVLSSFLETIKSHVFTRF